MYETQGQPSCKRHTTTAEITYLSSHIDSGRLPYPTLVKRQTKTKLSNAGANRLYKQNVPNVFIEQVTQTKKIPFSQYLL